jgi:hypothetical protein
VADALGASQLQKRHPHRGCQAVSPPGPGGLEGGRSCVSERVDGYSSSSGGGPSGQLEQEALQPHAEADRYLGVNTDRIFRCIEIERRIQDEAAAAILGAESAESAHSRDDGESSFLDVAAEDPFDPALDDVGNDSDEEDEEVVAVIAADDENAAAVALFCPRSQSLPAFVGRGVGVSGVESPVAFVIPGVGAASSAVSSSASRGGRLAKQIRQYHQGGV